MTERPHIGESALKKEFVGDEELGNLLAAFGNHEAKALTLALMQPGGVYRTYDLHRSMLRIQGKPLAWSMSVTVPFGYCTNSLAPIGLVVKEYLDLDAGIWGYEMSDYGKKRGLPLAGQLLNFSLENDKVSLGQLLGDTQSSGNIRSPLRRIRMFRELLKAKLPVRETDLMLALGQNDALEQHLQNLNSIGVIGYRAVEPTGAYSFYQLAGKVNQEKPKPYKNKRGVQSRPTLTNQIFEIFLKNREKKLTLEEIYNYLIEKDPPRKKQNKEGLISIIGNIAQYLKHEGFVEQDDFDYQRHSEINLSDEQRAFLIDFMAIMDAFQNQDPSIIESGSDLAKTIVNNSDRVSYLIGKARRASQNVDRLSSDETQSVISNIIENKPGISNKEIMKALEERGIKLRKQRTSKLTRLMEKGGIVTVIMDKNVKRFFSKDWFASNNF